VHPYRIGPSPTTADTPAGHRLRGSNHSREKLADSLFPVMADDQSPPPRRDDMSGAHLGWTALSYLIAGIGFWGFMGWLVDHWLHTRGIVTGIGCVLGAGAGIYLVMRRLGA
jgi:ATP synthase protein I